MANYEADNFIEEFIVEDLESGKHEGRIHTRFPTLLFKPTGM